MQRGFTQYQAKYFAHFLTREGFEDGDALTQSLSSARVDLNPHQVDAAMFALRSPLSKGVLLADEVGLGKTIEAALVLSQYWWSRQRNLLLIVPASLRKQWATELMEKFSLPSEILDAKRLKDITASGHPNPIGRAESIVILSYEFAARMASAIRMVPWHLVVFDEAHKLRNVYRAAETSRAAVLRDALAGRHKLLLTATPLQNNLMELFGLISVIDDTYFGSEQAFRAEFGGREEVASQALLARRLEPICKRTLRRQVQKAGLINYTNRLAKTFDFTPARLETDLYDLMSAYLQRSDTIALGQNGRHLVTLMLRKILGSSSFAVAQTLDKMVKRLQGKLIIDDKTLDDIDGFAEEAPTPGLQAPTAPPFKYAKPEEIGLAKTVLNVVLPQISKQVSSIKDLEDPKIVQRIADAAMAAQKAEDGLLSTVTPEQAKAVAAEVCKQFVQRTIAIPMLTITPEQHVSFGFRRFDVDLKSWNYQPLSRELLIQILRTEERSVISGDAGGETPSRLEDYVVAKLIDVPEIDYDAHADILYDLAGQVVAHFRAKHADDEQVRSILQGHARQIAEALVVQMKRHMWREQTNYRVTQVSAFDQLKPQTFDGSGKDAMRDYRSPPERLSDMKRFIFVGFEKSCYSMAKFDSDPERRMAVILEQDASVQLWMKPGPNQFRIYDEDNAPYQPDFVVETATDKLVIETKRASEMANPLVVRKADAAALWCHIANRANGEGVGDKPWSYLLVPETAVLSNATISGLMASHTRSVDADLLARYVLTEAA